MTIVTLLIGIPLGYVFETLRYAFLLGKPDTVHLAPISVKGKILEDMGHGGVAMALQAELVSVTDVLQGVLGDRPAPYLAPAAGRDTGYYLVGLRQEAPIPVELREHQELQEVKQELTLSVGKVSIPISGLANSIAALLGAVLIPYRNRYRNSTIKVSMVASGDQTRLTINLSGSYAADVPPPWPASALAWAKAALSPNAPEPDAAPRWWHPLALAWVGLPTPRSNPMVLAWSARGRSEAAPQGAQSESQAGGARGGHAAERWTHPLLLALAAPKQPTTRRGAAHLWSHPLLLAWADKVLASEATKPIVFTEIRTTTTLEEVSELIRDAAFMILHIHGSFQGRDWRSMRCLLDGLAALDEYRRTGGTDSKDQAKESFRCAALADPVNNPEALYYHGVMTMVDRTAESIDEAQRCYETALESPQTTHAQLRALLHTGMAFCYAQQFHRLAKLEPRVLEKASEEAHSAEREWAAAQRAATSPMTLHPLIPYTHALVLHVDEGSPDRHPDRLKRFVDAGNWYLKAIELQPDNGMFYNNLAWVLLKLTEWGDERDEEDIPSGLNLPEGRLDRKTAPLAEQYFRMALGLNPNNKLSHANLCLLYSTRWFRKPPGSLRRCFYHGKKALDLDNQYINGHRDLAVALVRYGELDEAYGYYTRALELAEDPDKDQEIVRDLQRELAAYEQRASKLTDDEWKRWREPDPRLFLPRERSRPSATGKASAGTVSASSGPDKPPAQKS